MTPGPRATRSTSRVLGSVAAYFAALTAVALLGASCGAETVTTEGSGSAESETSVTKNDDEATEEDSATEEGSATTEATATTDPTDEPGSTTLATGEEPRPSDQTDSQPSPDFLSAVLDADDLSAAGFDGAWSFELDELTVGDNPTCRTGEIGRDGGLLIDGTVESPDLDVSLGQIIGINDGPTGVEIFRELPNCADVGEELGTVEVVPVAVPGSTDSIAIKANDDGEASTWVVADFDGTLILVAYIGDDTHPVGKLVELVAASGARL